MPPPGDLPTPAIPGRADVPPRLPPGPAVDISPSTAGFSTPVPPPLSPVAGNALDLLSSAGAPTEPPRWPLPGTDGGAVDTPYPPALPDTPLPGVDGSAGDSSYPAALADGPLPGAVGSAPDDTHLINPDSAPHPGQAGGTVDTPYPPALPDTPLPGVAGSAGGPSYPAALADGPLPGAVGSAPGNTHLIDPDSVPHPGQAGGAIKPDADPNLEPAEGTDTTYISADGGKVGSEPGVGDGDAAKAPGPPSDDSSDEYGDSTGSISLDSVPSTLSQSTPSPEAREVVFGVRSILSPDAANLDEPEPEAGWVDVDFSPPPASQAKRAAHSSTASAEDEPEVQDGVVVDNPTSSGHPVHGHGYEPATGLHPAGDVLAATGARIDIEIDLRLAHNEKFASCVKDEAVNVRDAERVARDLERHRSTLRLALRDARNAQTVMVERASGLDDVAKLDAGHQSHHSLEYADQNQYRLERDCLAGALHAANEDVATSSRNVMFLESSCDAADAAVTAHARDESDRAAAVMASMEMLVRTEDARSAAASLCMRGAETLFREHVDRQAVVATGELSPGGSEPLRFDDKVDGVIMAANLAGLNESGVDGVTTFNDQVRSYAKIPVTPDRTDDGDDWYPKLTDVKLLPSTHPGSHPPDHFPVVIPPGHVGPRIPLATTTTSGGPSLTPDPTVDAGLACAGPLLDALEKTRTRPVVRQEGPQGPSSIPGEIQFRVAVILQSAHKGSRSPGGQYGSGSHGAAVVMCTPSRTFGSEPLADLGDDDVIEPHSGQQFGLLRFQGEVRQAACAVDNGEGVHDEDPGLHVPSAGLEDGEFGGRHFAAYLPEGTTAMVQSQLFEVGLTCCSEAGVRYVGTLPENVDRCRESNPFRGGEGDVPMACDQGRAFFHTFVIEACWTEDMAECDAAAAGVPPPEYAADTRATSYPVSADTAACTCGHTVPALGLGACKGDGDVWPPWNIQTPEGRLLLRRVPLHHLETPGSLRINGDLTTLCRIGMAYQTGRRVAGVQCILGNEVSMNLGLSSPVGPERTSPRRSDGQWTASQRGRLGGDHDTHIGYISLSDAKRDVEDRINELAMDAGLPADDCNVILDETRFATWWADAQRVEYTRHVDATVGRGGDVSRLLTHPDLDGPSGFLGTVAALISELVSVYLLSEWAGPDPRDRGRRVDRSLLGAVAGYKKRLLTGKNKYFGQRLSTHRAVEVLEKMDGWLNIGFFSAKFESDPRGSDEDGELWEAHQRTLRADDLHASCARKRKRARADEYGEAVRVSVLTELFVAEEGLGLEIRELGRLRADKALHNYNVEAEFVEIHDRAVTALGLFLYEPVKYLPPSTLIDHAITDGAERECARLWRDVLSGDDSPGWVNPSSNSLYKKTLWKPWVGLGKDDAVSRRVEEFFAVQFGYRKVIVPSGILFDGPESWIRRPDTVSTYFSPSLQGTGSFLTARIDYGIMDDDAGRGVYASPGFHGSGDGHHEHRKSRGFYAGCTWVLAPVLAWRDHSASGRTTLQSVPIPHDGNFLNDHTLEVTALLEATHGTERRRQSLPAPAATIRCRRSLSRTKASDAHYVARQTGGRFGEGLATLYDDAGLRLPDECTVPLHLTTVMGVRRPAHDELSDVAFIRGLSDVRLRVFQGLCLASEVVRSPGQLNLPWNATLVALRSDPLRRPQSNGPRWVNPGQCDGFDNGQAGFSDDEENLWGKTAHDWARACEVLCGQRKYLTSVEAVRTEDGAPYNAWSDPSQRELVTNFADGGFPGQPAPLVGTSEYDLVNRFDGPMGSTAGPACATWDCGRSPVFGRLRSSSQLLAVSIDSPMLSQLYLPDPNARAGLNPSAPWLTVLEREAGYANARTARPAGFRIRATAWARQHPGREAEDYEEEHFGLPLSPVMRATIFLRGVAEAVVEQGSYIKPDGTTGGVTIKPPLWSAVVGVSTTGLRGRADYDAVCGRLSVFRQDAPLRERHLFAGSLLFGYHRLLLAHLACVSGRHLAPVTKNGTRGCPPPSVMESEPSFGGISRLWPYSFRACDRPTGKEFGPSVSALNANADAVNAVHAGRLLASVGLHFCLQGTTLANALVTLTAVDLALATGATCFFGSPTDKHRRLHEGGGLAFSKVPNVELPGVEGIPAVQKPSVVEASGMSRADMDFNRRHLRVLETATSAMPDEKDMQDTMLRGGVTLLAAIRRVRALIRQLPSSRTDGFGEREPPPDDPSDYGDHDRKSFVSSTASEAAGPCPGSFPVALGLFEDSDTWGPSTMAGISPGHGDRRALATAVGVFKASQLGSVEAALHLLFCLSGCMWSGYLQDLKGNGERFGGSDSWRRETVSSPFVDGRGRIFDATMESPETSRTAVSPEGVDLMQDLSSRHHRSTYMQAVLYTGIPACLPQYVLESACHLLGILDAPAVRLYTSHPDNRMVCRSILLSDGQGSGLLEPPYQLQTSGAQSAGGALSCGMHDDWLYFARLNHARRSMGDSSTGSGLSWGSPHGSGSNQPSRGTLVDGGFMPRPNRPFEEHAAAVNRHGSHARPRLAIAADWDHPQASGRSYENAGLVSLDSTRRIPDRFLNAIWSGRPPSHANVIDPYDVLAPTGGYVSDEDENGESVFQNGHRRREQGRVLGLGGLVGPQAAEVDEVVDQMMAEDGPGAADRARRPDRVREGAFTNGVPYIQPAIVPGRRYKKDSAPVLGELIGEGLDDITRSGVDPDAEFPWVPIDTNLSSDPNGAKLRAIANEHWMTNKSTCHNIETRQCKNADCALVFNVCSNRDIAKAHGCKFWEEHLLGQVEGCAVCSVGFHHELRPDDWEAERDGAVFPKVALYCSSECEGHVERDYDRYDPTAGIRRLRMAEMPEMGDHSGGAEDKRKLRSFIALVQQWGERVLGTDFKEALLVPLIVLRDLTVDDANQIWTGLHTKAFKDLKRGFSDLKFFKRCDAEEEAEMLDPPSDDDLPSDHESEPDLDGLGDQISENDSHSDSDSPSDEARLWSDAEGADGSGGRDTTGGGSASGSGSDEAGSVGGQTQEEDQICDLCHVEGPTRDTHTYLDPEAVGLLPGGVDKDVCTKCFDSLAKNIVSRGAYSAPAPPAGRPAIAEGCLVCGTCVDVASNRLCGPAQCFGRSHRLSVDAIRRASRRFDVDHPQCRYADFEACLSRAGELDSVLQRLLQEECLVNLSTTMEVLTSLEHPPVDLVSMITVVSESDAMQSDRFRDEVAGRTTSNLRRILERYRLNFQEYGLRRLFGEDVHDIRMGNQGLRWDGSVTTLESLLESSQAEDGHDVDECESNWSCTLCHDAGRCSELDPDLGGYLDGLGDAVAGAPDWVGRCCTLCESARVDPPASHSTAPAVPDGAVLFYRVPKLAGGRASCSEAMVRPTAAQVSRAFRDGNRPVDLVCPDGEVRSVRVLSRTYGVDPSVDEQTVIASVWSLLLSDEVGELRLVHAHREGDKFLLGDGSTPVYFLTEPPGSTTRVKMLGRALDSADNLLLPDPSAGFKVRASGRAKDKKLGLALLSHFIKSEDVARRFDASPSACRAHAAIGAASKELDAAQAERASVRSKGLQGRSPQVRAARRGIRAATTAHVAALSQLSGTLSGERVPFDTGKVFRDFNMRPRGADGAVAFPPKTGDRAALEQSHVDDESISEESIRWAMLEPLTDASLAASVLMNREGDGSSYDLGEDNGAGDDEEDLWTDSGDDDFDGASGGFLSGPSTPPSPPVSLPPASTPAPARLPTTLSGPMPATETGNLMLSSGVDGLDKSGATTFRRLHKARVLDRLREEGFDIDRLFSESCRRKSTRGDVSKDPEAPTAARIDAALSEALRVSPRRWAETEYGERQDFVHWFVHDIWDLFLQPLCNGYMMVAYTMLTASFIKHKVFSDRAQKRLQEKQADFMHVHTSERISEFIRGWRLGRRTTGDWALPPFADRAKSQVARMTQGMTDKDDAQFGFIDFTTLRTGTDRVKFFELLLDECYHGYNATPFRNAWERRMYDGLAEATNISLTPHADWLTSQDGPELLIAAVRNQQRTKVRKSTPTEKIYFLLWSMHGELSLRLYARYGDNCWMASRYNMRATEDEYDRFCEVYSELHLDFHSRGKLRDNARSRGSVYSSGALSRVGGRRVAPSTSPSTARRGQSAWHNKGANFSNSAAAKRFNRNPTAVSRAHYNVVRKMRTPADTVEFEEMVDQNVSVFDTDGRVYGLAGDLSRGRAGVAGDRDECLSHDGSSCADEYEGAEGVGPWNAGVTQGPWTRWDHAPSPGYRVGDKNEIPFQVNRISLKDPDRPNTKEVSDFMAYVVARPDHKASETGLTPAMVKTLNSSMKKWPTFGQLPSQKSSRPSAPPVKKQPCSHCSGGRWGEEYNDRYQCRNCEAHSSECCIHRDGRAVLGDAACKALSPGIVASMVHRGYPGRQVNPFGNDRARNEAQRDKVQTWYKENPSGGRTLQRQR
jgi:hypothetical protein